MPPSPPPEILDLIVDQLHDELAALKACCVVSKSWVPRSRRHLFARVAFDAPESSVESWMETFPDPSNSPAHHTRSLSIRGLPAAVAAGTDGSSWVRAFQHVVTLNVDTREWDDSQVTFVPLHGLSPTLKSLRVTYSFIPLSEVFNLICSFSLLEDLALISLDPNGSDDGQNTSSTSPRLTGSLYLETSRGIRFVVRRLCNLPGGLHFSKVAVRCFNEDAESTMDLVSRCSDTLESLKISYCIPSTFPSTSKTRQLIDTLPPLVDLETFRTPSLLDLSEARKLKHLVLRYGMPSIRWITMALQTAKSKNLQTITIRPDATTFGNPVGVTLYEEWQELDDLLVQLWTSRSIRPKVMCRGSCLILLPELTRRGLVDPP